MKTSENRTRDLPACSTTRGHRNHKIEGFKYLRLFVLSCLSFRKHKGPLFGVLVHVLWVPFYYFPLLNSLLWLTGREYRNLERHDQVLMQLTKDGHKSNV